MAAAVAYQRVASIVSIPTLRHGCRGRFPCPHAQPALRMRHRSHRQPLCSQIRWSSENSTANASRKYTFDDIRARVAQAEASAESDASASPLVIIDVREPSELAATGRIPTAHNLPISSLPDGLFLPPEEFRDKFGFEKPASGSEVVFYCKAGVRSRTAAAMVAPEWNRQGVKVGEFPGSWNEWAARGGEAQR